MKSPTHLLPVLAAILLVVTGLSGGVLYAQSVERKYVHALAPQLLRLNLVGSALQREAFCQPDLLPVYGSSEISIEVKGYTAPEVFGTYPTGFAPFEVAKGGVNSLIMAQDIAAVGPDLRGKKVVISFTPSMFLSHMILADRYDGLFSRLHANELAFSTELSFATKHEAAKRMLQYPQSLKKEPLLRFALERLADGSPLNLAMYYAVWPLGKLWTLVLELQDHWETLSVIWARPGLNPTVPHVPAVIDWQALGAKAEQEQEAHANNNPFGFDNNIWLARYSKLLEHYGELLNTKKAPLILDKAAIKNLRETEEWTDLDILLRILNEMGAQPLIMSRPFSASFWEVRGITAQDRQAYYDRLRQMAARYGMPEVDFQDHEKDKYFSVDDWSHTSRKGWVYVDKTLDDFYRGALR